MPRCVGNCVRARALHLNRCMQLGQIPHLSVCGLDRRHMYVSPLALAFRSDSTAFYAKHIGSADTLHNMQAFSETQLEQLVADSKDPQMAQQMVSRQVPDQLMRLLAHHVTEIAAAGAGAALPIALRNSMLHTLRIVRNLCAAGDAAVKQLLRADAASWLTSSASALLNLQPGADVTRPQKLSTALRIYL